MGGDELRVTRVEASATLELRNRVLRPGVPPSEVTWGGDDRPETATLAVLARIDGAGERPVATVTVMPEPYPVRPDEVPAWRLRAMATDDGWRGRGVGRLALDAAIALVADAGGVLLWCNARVVALPFYGRAGFTVDGPAFDIEGIGPHHEMSRVIDPVVDGSARSVDLSAG